MPQTEFGQTDALALAVVAWLNDNSPGLAVPVSAERRFSRITDLKNIPTFDQPASVDVFPNSQATHREGLHAFSSHYAIHIYIQQQVAGAADPEAQCALLTQMHSQILDKIRTYPFAMPNAVRPLMKNQLVFLDAKNSDKGLYDLGRLEELHVFESDTILIFKASA